MQKKKKSAVCILLIVFMWFVLLSLFVFHQLTESINVSPYTAHNLINIGLQVILIFFPIGSLLLAFFIYNKLIKYIFILVSLFLTYYFSLAHVLAWIEYF